MHHLELEYNDGSGIWSDSNAIMIEFPIELLAELGNRDNKDTSHRRASHSFA
jgi:hypothetical protein